MVKGKPCIWDKDKFRREKAWAEIYNELYPKYSEMKEGQKIKIGQQISKKWFNIRDTYVKSVKGLKKRPYIYAHTLSFLDQVITCEPKTTQDQVESEDSKGLDGDDEPEIWLNESFIDIQDNDVKRQKIEEKDYIDKDKMVSFFSEMIKREEDEDRAFFTSIIPQVKSLSEKSKIDFRIQVMKLLKKMKNHDSFHNRNDSDSE